MSAHPSELLAVPPLSVAEVATLLGVSQQIVRDSIRKKHLQAGKIGGQWRVRREDLADYIAAAFEKV